MMKKALLWLLLAAAAVPLRADYLLIPMDNVQKEHLKAYGVAYMVLEYGVEVDWLLNYRGGSFMFRLFPRFEEEMRLENVTYERISDGRANDILAYVASDAVNMDAVKLEKAPKIAVYSPKNKQPWDDAVTLALTYAKIPYDVVYDDEVMQDKLSEYDWLHLHHEDFTGQYGKFWASYRSADWYVQDVKIQEENARRWGFNKVSQLKFNVVKRIHTFMENGGFMFAMCSATDTYDIALAAERTDICEHMFDGDPMDPRAQSNLDYSPCIAFHNFQLVTNPIQYEFSDIDTNTGRERLVTEANDLFTLFEFSAKWDPVPTMLCQNHTRMIKGFWGQTTGFQRQLLKPDVLVMGEFKAINETRYIHGNYGKGMWTFYGGHDPEDYRHQVGEEPTDLSLHPNSPGYRLILNNILFPAARKKHQKT